ncbi:cupin domain-containing protein [Amycolatopsis sp. NPDC051373]|uniref:cupin domain-containing protein n=1 Tax=Amycolatopsis sp. NPDC051373 TaxID=3155801 RepID=UPI00344CA995
MIAKRITASALALSVLAGVTACTAADEPTDQPAAATSMAPNPKDTAGAKPPAESLTPLIQQALPDVQGKTFTSAIVDFPPGAVAAPHRHGQAFVYAYVLEGTVRSQLDDKPITTFHQGQNWVEQPGTHHVLTQNTSQTARARLLVVFVSDIGDPLKVNDPHS